MCRSWFLFIVICLSGREAFSSSFYPQDLSTTLEGTPTVIRGKVGSIRSDFSKTPDGGQQLYTYTELIVTEVLKGKTENTKVLVRELGGQKNGVTMEIPGAVRFKTGEDVVLMLGQNTQDQGSETFPIQNMGYGKLNVEKDADGKEILKGAALNGAPPSGEKSWTIGDVKNLILHPAPSPSKAVLFDASAKAEPDNGGKSGLLSDSAKPKTKTDGEITPDAKGSPIPGAGESETANRMPNRGLILIGILIGVALFLRSYLKKRQ